MVLQCTNNNKPCNESLLIEDVISQDYGRCYSFIQNSSVAASGRTYGLKVTFDLEIHETMGLFSPNSGLKLYLTQPGLVGDTNDSYVSWESEINLPPGFDHSISVHPKEVLKLGEPFNDCEVYTSGRLKGYHSEKECQTICHLRFVDNLASKSTWPMVDHAICELPIFWILVGLSRCMEHDNLGKTWS